MPAKAKLTPADHAYIHRMAAIHDHSSPKAVAARLGISVHYLYEIISAKAADPRGGNRAAANRRLGALLDRYRDPVAGQDGDRLVR